MKRLNDYITEFVNINNIKKQSNNLEYVDLDLPSGNLWANCNLGADSPEDEGLLFQFGCIDGYRFNDNNHNFLTVNEYKSKLGKKYSRGDEINNEDDAAYHLTNGEAKIPRYTDFDELFEYCNYKYTNRNGIYGMLISSKNNNNKNSIFLPVTHTYIARAQDFREATDICLWSSSSNNDNAFHFKGNNEGYYMIGYFKYNANPIRPIKSNS